MNTYKCGDRVSYLCGGNWVYATVLQKLEGEECFGKWKLFPSNIDPQYKLKSEKENKTIFQHASGLQSTENSQKESAGAGSELSQESGRFEAFNDGAKVCFSNMQGKCFCGTLKRKLNDKEEFDGVAFFASKKDPQYFIACNDESEWLVPASVLKTKESAQCDKHNQGLQQGAHPGLGSQTGVGSQSAECGGDDSSARLHGSQSHLAGSQGHHGSQGVHHSQGHEHDTGAAGSQGQHHSSQGQHHSSQGQHHSSQDNVVPIEVTHKF